MSEDMRITPGASVAADECSGTLYPRVKLCFGPDGSAYDASNANPLPVAVISGGGGSSGGLTDAELRASPVPVSGTVGVSGSVTVVNGLDVDVLTMPSITGTVAVSNFPASQAVTGPLTDTQLRASAVAVSGPLTDTQLRATAVPISAPALTKATQGANGWSVQDLKDAGRVIKAYSATFTAATTEALVTLTPIADGTAGATGTSFGVTAGKRLRLQALSVNTKNAGAAGQGVVVNFRMSASGAVTASSPLVATCAAGTYLAIANITNNGNIVFPDGLELSGNMQFGISQIGTATAGNTVTLIGYEY